MIIEMKFYVVIKNEDDLKDNGMSNHKIRFIFHLYLP